MFKKQIIPITPPPSPQLRQPNFLDPRRLNSPPTAFAVLSGFTNAIRPGTEIGERLSACPQLLAGSIAQTRQQPKGASLSPGLKRPDLMIWWQCGDMMPVHNWRLSVCPTAYLSGESGTAVWSLSLSSLSLSLARALSVCLSLCLSVCLSLSLSLSLFHPRSNL